MNWISSIQRAIDYVETHITEELDYREIAKQANSSSFHFQRIFGILCGFTLGDYIRMRRLSLAGMELASSDFRILDIAVKYGYDTQEGFSRAFTRFHKISPSQARAGEKLKSFSRLSLKLILDGGDMMNYRIEKKAAFDIICKKIVVDPGRELTSAEISEFWQRCNTDGTVSSLCEYISADSIFGNSIVGATFGKDASDTDFPYAVGVPYNGSPVGERDFTVTEIPPHTYAVFTCVGAMPDSFNRMYNQIYSEFFPVSEYQPCDGTDFEAYPSADVNDPRYTCEIWVAVEKNDRQTDHTAYQY